MSRSTLSATAIGAGLLIVAAWLATPVPTQITADSASRVTVGMKYDEVEQFLGRPRDETDGLGAGGEPIYPYMPTLALLLSHNANVRWVGESVTVEVLFNRPADTVAEVCVFETTVKGDGPIDVLHHRLMRRLGYGVRELPGLPAWTVRSHTSLTGGFGGKKKSRSVPVSETSSR